LQDTQRSRTALRVAPVHCAARRWTNAPCHYPCLGSAFLGPSFGLCGVGFVASIRFRVASARNAASSSEYSLASDMRLGDMTAIRELTEGEAHFCTLLGRVVMLWNHVENSMRLLLLPAIHVGEDEQKVMTLIANLGNVGLSEALEAVSDDHPEGIRVHLRHCAKLFELERTYRNYYVHNPVGFVSTPHMTSAYASHVTAKGGSLKSHIGQVTPQRLTDFTGRLTVLDAYVTTLGEDECWRDSTLLSSLKMPPLPDTLILHRQRLIERQPPPQA